jgi:hypothetical protein
MDEKINRVKMGRRESKWKTNESLVLLYKKSTTGESNSERERGKEEIVVEKAKGHT